MSFLPRRSIESEKVEGLRPTEPPIALQKDKPRAGIRLELTRETVLTALVLFAAAFLLRAHGAVSFPQQVDERHWVNRSARVVARIARGDGSVATSHLGHPGIPAALGMAFAQKAGGVWNEHVVSGVPPLQVDKVASSRLGAAALSCLVVPILFLCAIPFIGRNAALLAAVLLAFDPQHIAFSRLAHIDGTLVTLVTACVFCFIFSELRPSLGRTILGGVVFGLALGTKPTVIALVPALLAARLLMRSAGLSSSPFIHARDVLWLGVAHLVLLATWTKLWDPMHNFISLHRIRLDSAEWVRDAGRFLHVHAAVGAIVLGAAAAIPLLYHIRRRRAGRGSLEALLCLCFIPAAVLLLWLYSLPLENILRFWGWVAGLSHVKHYAYGVAVAPQDTNYAEIWWRRTSPMCWLGILLLIPLMVRRSERRERQLAFVFCAVCLLVGVVWTGVLNVSPKQAFRYVMPAYPLVLAASAYALVRTFSGMPRPIPKLLLATGVLPVLLLSASRLPFAILSLNPLSPSFADAVAAGLIPTPVQYHEALELAHASAPPPGGRPDTLEVIGDLELVRAEYLRRYAPEEHRLYIGPYRGGMGADWVLEMKGWNVPTHTAADFRTFAERPLQISYRGVALTALYRIVPPRIGETRVASVRYSLTRVARLREDPWKSEVRRVVPPEKADYAFFELPVKVGSGRHRFVYPIRLDRAEQEEDRETDSRYSGHPNWN